MTIILLRCTSRLRWANNYLLLNCPALDWALLIVLLHPWVSRLIAVMLLLKFALLLNLLRIPIPRILALVDRQRCRLNVDIAVPFVPTSSRSAPSHAPNVHPSAVAHPTARRRSMSAAECSTAPEFSI